MQDFFRSSQGRALVLGGGLVLLMAILGTSLFLFLSRDSGEEITEETREVALTEEEQASAQGFVAEYLEYSGNWGVKEGEDIFSPNPETYFEYGKTKYLSMRNYYFDQASPLYKTDGAMMNVPDDFLLYQGGSFTLLNHSEEVEETASIRTIRDSDETVAKVNVDTVSEHSIIATPSDAPPEGMETSIYKSGVSFAQSFTVELIKEGDSWLIYNIIGRDYPFAFTDFFADFNESTYYQAINSVEMTDLGTVQPAN